MRLSKAECLRGGGGVEEEGRQRERKGGREGGEVRLLERRVKVGESTRRGAVGKSLSVEGEWMRMISEVASVWRGGLEGELGDSVDMRELKRSGESFV